MTKLMDLPVELLEEIVSTLDTFTLKHLRLTCRLLSNLATEILFRIFGLHPTTKSIDRLCGILKHDILKGCVREVYLTNAVHAKYVNYLLACGVYANQQSQILGILWVRKRKRLGQRE